MSDRFLPQEDQLAALINAQALALYSKLVNLPVDSLGLPAHCLYYFKNSHFNRLFFSIETSAHLLYRSISLQHKPVGEIVIMDYGAGVGTLYTLAKMIGCKKVIYNDFLEEWQFSAQKIAEAIQVQIDEYILGDIGDTLSALKDKNIVCDIITSRNVIEHVYKLDHFYASIHMHQPHAFIYSSTTANIYNPGAHIKHVLWHRRWEKEYLAQRKEMIASMGLVNDDTGLQRLARSTQGLAMNDLFEAVRVYSATKKLPDHSIHYTNTCQPSNGVWAEHLLTFRHYRAAIGEKNYLIDFRPGFWDTHYRQSWKNVFGRLMNALIRVTGKAGIVLAPFIYVIAQPIKAQR